MPTGDEAVRPLAHAWWDDEVGMFAVSYMGWAAKAPTGGCDPAPVREA